MDPQDSAKGPKVREYSDLDAPEGVRTNFRPERFSSRDLGVRDLLVELRLGDRIRSASLRDVSQSGVAFQWPEGEDLPAAGVAIAEVVVRFETHDAYRGAATVVSVRHGDEGVVVGASFADGLMDIDDVLHVRDVRALHTQNARALELRAKEWYSESGTAFRGSVAETRMFLEEAEKTFKEMEEAIPWHVVYGEVDSPARLALMESLRSGFVNDYLHLFRRLEAGLMAADPGDESALKCFSQRSLDGLLLQAPLLSRARKKPLGYPGDMQVMRYLYGAGFDGATLFSKALNYANWFAPGAEMVRTRKDLMRERLLERVKRLRAGEVLRVASVAAGPAQEVFEMLTALEEFEGEIEFVLFDQEPSALQFAHRRMTQLIEARWARRVRVKYMHDTIKRFLKDPQMFAPHGPFEVVICAGLFDYLDLRQSTLLGRSLYSAVSSGGTVYMGNIVPDHPSKWMMHFHMDWYLKYKSREQMMSFAADGAPGAHVSIVEERSGWNPFVAVTRP